MLARPEHTEDDFASVFTHQHDLDATITDDEQRIARIILEQNDAALRIALLARQLREALQLGVLELGEERNCPQEVGYLHQSECSAREQVVTILPATGVPEGYSVDGRRQRRRVTNKCAVASRMPSRPCPRA